MTSSKSEVEWHGRFDWTDVRSQHHSRWETMLFPEGVHPMTAIRARMVPWTPITIWLPHPPVRKRGRRA